MEPDRGGHVRRRVPVHPQRVHVRCQRDGRDRGCHTERGQFDGGHGDRYRDDLVGHRVHRWTASSATLDIREEATGTITGRAFLDDEGDDTDDGVEPGVAGQVVRLVVEGVVVQETTTNSDGTYNFVDVVSGQYTVRLLPDNGYLATNGTVEGFWSNYIEVPVGGNVIDVSFSMQQGLAPGAGDTNPCLAAPPPPAGPKPPQVQHGIDWSTLRAYTVMVTVHGGRRCSAPDLHPLAA